jgi:POT family proton-dependent oligopeptide transporter
LGITLTIIGTGFFKPNISSMVGELYKVGTVVEMLVLDCFIRNIGALLEDLCVLRNKSRLRLSYAFLSAAIVMVGLLFNNETLGPMVTLHYRQIFQKNN